MTKSEFDKALWNDFKTRIETSDFKDHRVRLVELKDPLAEIGDDSKAMTVITWKKPGTSNCAVTYMVWRNRLIVTGDLGEAIFVTGDLGEAIFVWGEGIDLKFLETCDYSYFCSKCQGIDGHMKLRQWDPDKVRAGMEEWLVENSSVKDSVDGWQNHIASYEEWSVFAHENDVLVHEEPYNWGYTFHYRAMAIWLGLKLAIAALKAVDESPSGS